MKRRFPTWLAILAIGPALLFSAKLGLGQPFDPLEWHKQPIIFNLVDALDARGVDVLYNFGSPGAERTPDRPRLAPLDGFPTSEDPVDALIMHDTDLMRWRDAYQQSVHGGMVAAKARGAGPGPGRHTASLWVLYNEWVKAPSENRIFISYTSANQAQADVIREQLIEKGYVVFTFKQTNGEFTTDMLGVTACFFKTAGTRLVIDSKEARLSPGVLMEAKYERVVREYAAHPDRIDDRNERLFNDYPLFSPSGGPGGILLGIPMEGGDPYRLGTIGFEPGEGAFIRDSQGRSLFLPKTDPVIVSECLAFATSARPRGTMITIDVTRKVRLNPALEDTAIGNVIVRADTAPFDNFIVDGAAKSRIIDEKVRLQPLADTSRLGFETRLRVYFLAEMAGSADVIVRFFLASEKGTAGFRLDDEAIDAKPPADFPADGVKRLAKRLEPLAECAAWISFFRWANSVHLNGLDRFAAHLRSSVANSPKVTTPRSAERDDTSGALPIRIRVRS